MIANVDNVEPKKANWFHIIGPGFIVDRHQDEQKIKKGEEIGVKSGLQSVVL